MNLFWTNAALPLQDTNGNNLFYNAFLSAFKALIGNLDELKKKDYGDMERGATRYNCTILLSTR